MDFHIGYLLRGDESLDIDFISYPSHGNLELGCDFKNNLLFDSDMTIKSVHSGISCNIEYVVTLEGYKLFANPLWCYDTLYENKNLFLRDDNIFIEKDSVKKDSDACMPIVTYSLCVSILHKLCDASKSKSGPFYENMKMMLVYVTPFSIIYLHIMILMFL